MDNKEVATKVAEIEETRLDLMEWKDIEGLYYRGAKYSAEKKIQAVTNFIILGSLKKAAEMAGIPAGTVRTWSSKASWWKDVMDKIRKQHNDELDAKICILIDKSMAEIDDRIVNGDVVLGKDGREWRKKINGKDLTTMVGILYDKRALMRGDPTARTASASPQSVLKQLSGEFEKLAKQIKEKKIEDSIPGVLNGKS